MSPAPQEIHKSIQVNIFKVPIYVEDLPLLYGNTKQKAHNQQLRAKDALQRNSIRRGWIKEQKSEPEEGKSRIRGNGGGTLGRPGYIRSSSCPQSELTMFSVFSLEEGLACPAFNGNSLIDSTLGTSST